ncbi:MAG: low specificity L-threonine aldolase [Aestuariivirga sp.]|uniref:threonine aldolase family protein n=1 Tax=Aestuariivirga sp. TaxID=2650926 RepID=UPI0025C70D75|nr:low specificity L-threonine aldolase [Aestuariivirga sp.]MCA3561876.1 low specificity L-threonine aldolase [Aestuariivirga sp.]
MNFASDNVYGVHPKILAALTQVNGGTAPSYGGDDQTRRAEEMLRQVFECELRAFLVTSGTAANGFALSTITPGFGAIFCNAEAHIAVDECNSPEFFTGGAKIIGLNGPSGKITPGQVEKALNGFIRGEHDPKPKGVSLTNATELGTVYSPAEVKAFSGLIRPRGMKLHMDGARFANAVAGLGCTPAELTWKAGVDVMSFGATKNGAMMLEAVVFFDLGLAEDFAYRRMRGGQLLSKSRYLGAQMIAYLENGLWLENARRANALAQKLAGGLTAGGKLRIPNPVEANEVFAVMPKTMFDRLQAEGAKFYDWMPDSLGDAIAADEKFARFVLSFATPEEEVDAFVRLVAQD